MIKKIYKDIKVYRDEKIGSTDRYMSTSLGKLKVATDIVIGGVKLSINDSVICEQISTRRYIYRDLNNTPEYHTHYDKFILNVMIYDEPNGVIVDTKEITIIIHRPLDNSPLKLGELVMWESLTKNRNYDNDTEEIPL